MTVTCLHKKLHIQKSLNIAGFTDTTYQKASTNFVTFYHFHNTKKRFQTPAEKATGWCEQQTNKPAISKDSIRTKARKKFSTATSTDQNKWADTKKRQMDDRLDCCRTIVCYIHGQNFMVVKNKLLDTHIECSTCILHSM